MKKIRILISVAVVGSMLMAVPAVAAPALPDASIDVSMAESEGATTSSALETESVSYGDTVEIQWWIDESKLAKKHYITVMMRCQQGDDIVFTDFRGVNGPVEFLLADNWVNTDKWDGGDAECTATLRYYARNKLSNVAETTFNVFGNPNSA